MRVQRLTSLLTLFSVAIAEAEWPYDDESFAGGQSVPVEIGARVGYDYDGETTSAGGQLCVPIGRGGRFIIVPSSDIYFDGEGVDWQANVDVMMSPGPRGGFYAGLGFGWAKDDGDRNRAVNQVIGLRLPLSGLWAYAEGRWTELERGTAIRVVGGLNIPLFRY